VHRTAPSRTKCSGRMRESGRPCTCRNVGPHISLSLSLFSTTLTRPVFGRLLEFALDKPLVPEAHLAGAQEEEGEELRRQQSGQHGVKHHEPRGQQRVVAVVEPGRHAHHDQQLRNVFVVYIVCFMGAFICDLS